MGRTQSIAVESCLLGAMVVLVVLSPACSQIQRRQAESDAKWENETVGIDFMAVLEGTHLAWLVPCPQAVTCILELPEQNRIWAGTADGIVICKSDGRSERRVFACALGEQERGEGIGSFRRVHHLVKAMVRLEDGTIWVRGLWGASRLSPQGKVIEDWISDKRTVEHQYGLILKEPALQQHFPVLGRTVYLPYAGQKVAGYDGKGWHLVGKLPQDSATRQVHVMGDDVLAAGRGGLIRVSDGSHLIRSDSYGEFKRLSAGTGIFVGGGAWLLDGEKVTRIGDYPEAQGLGLCQPEANEIVWSCFEADYLSIFDVRDGPGATIRTVRLPAEHRWTGFMSPRVAMGADSPNPASAEAGEPVFYVLTRVGILSTDLKTVKELMRIPVPKLAPPLDKLSGVGALAGLKGKDAILIGTAIGLARYDMKSETVEWLWRAQEWLNSRIID